ncbi:uncharacterized protein EI97DRAFT_397398 [Westerdykella ornata]|uniref:MFS general substrate transporter n=1 Tax=Westerdykella ornata TaxID=318751 RepID=A0A6A6JJ32_WESOR|nr:uncharacterized protein EI97DRAFT_397398 [Westerdykella ornata]KAF2276640.1 hypothetical protein EI97DRAFT_397398 [Westerdykella ornata]
MSNHIPNDADEESPLIRDEILNPHSKSDSAHRDSTPEHVLPIALLASLAMASTAATSYYAYATLLCRDPAHCRGDEKSRYAGTVAVAVSAANVFGILALGHLQKLSVSNQKLGLLLWMGTRSMSAVMLLLGVFFKSIFIALSGRIFEGLASDNLLHYVLNAIYSQTNDDRRTSTLIGSSMALYLAGISISPFVAGLFQNFTISFFIALGLFVFAIVYLQIFIPSRSGSTSRKPTSTEEAFSAAVPRNQDRDEPWRNLMRTISSPLISFRQHPKDLTFGLSLLAYNLVQSYMFSALLVHTSLQFNFTGRENGILISLAHSVAAVYLALALYILPSVLRAWRSRSSNDARSSSKRTAVQKDALLATLSQIIQVLSLIGLGFASTAKQIYALTAFLALSLPASSFIKGAFVATCEGEEKTRGLAALAAMETVGSVLGPLVIGGWQSYSVAGPTVFFIAAGIAAFSMVLFCLGVVGKGTFR